MSTTNFTQLREQIDQTFDEEEVRNLCSDIGVDYDNLGGRGKVANVRELLAHCQRHSLLPELQTALEAERSHINWRNLISPLLPRSSSPLPLYHIPFHQNPNFTGREELMQQLQSLIANQKSKIVIAGLGGMGKTQLVLEYCYHHDEYGLIYWLNADDVPAVNEGLAGLAYELGLMRREAGDPEAAVQAALRWLAQTEERWLLVYDNADQIEPPALLPYLPKMGNGVCLITSRNANWQAVTGAEGLLRLDVFTETEAVGFLRERLGRGEESDEEDAERELVAELGYFPLALEHAAAYMAAYGRGVTDYLALYQRQRQALWQRAEIRQDYQKTITTTWELAFEQARQTSGAMALLNLCCFLDGEGIPLALLTDYSDNLPEELAACVADELDLGDAIVALRRYSLLQREREELVVHRLVQAVGRDRMRAERQEIWGKAALEVMAAAFHFDEYEMGTWLRCSQLLSHATHVIQSVQHITGNEETIALLCHEIGLYFSHQGNFPESLAYTKRALDIREKVLGTDHPDTATSLNNMGELVQVRQLEDARPFFQRALDIREKVLEAEHPDTASSLTSMGWLLEEMRQLENARPFFQRALDIREKVLGAEHPATATTLNDIGYLLHCMGRLEEAQVFYHRALNIREKVLGTEHPDTASSLDHMGMLLKEIGMLLRDVELLEEGLPFLKRALDIREKVLGTEHPNTANSLNNMGYLLKDMGRLEEAQPFLQRALDIREKVLGDEHINTGISLFGMGAFLKDMGRFEEALPFYQRALAILEGKYGTDHPETAITLLGMGTILKDMGQLEEAQPFLQRALAILETKLGTDHPRTKRVRHNLESSG